MNAREILFEVRYIVAGQAVVGAAAVALYFLLSLTAAVLGIVVGLLLLQSAFHVVWTYENILDDGPETNHPLLLAIAVVAMNWVIAIVAAVAFFVVMLWLSMITGIPLLIPGAIALLIGFFLYTLYVSRSED